LLYRRRRTGRLVPDKNHPGTRIAGLVLAVLTIVSRPSSDQTWARSRRKPDRPAVQVAGLTGFLLRRFADFSYVT
jgi:hypothetical protein